MPYRRAPSLRSQEARDALILQYRYLPRWFVNRYRSHGPVAMLGADDAEGYAYLGLIRAAECWDEARGVKFVTYATRSIWSTVLKAAQTYGSTIRLPQWRWRSGERPMKQRRGRKDADTDPLANVEDRHTQSPCEGETLAQLTEAIATLSDREKEVVRLLFWEGMRQKHLVKRLKITPQRVSQIKQEVIGRLRAAMGVSEPA